MPKEIYNSNYSFLKKDNILSFEEILRVVKVLNNFHIKKIRITGGEPLIRRNVSNLIRSVKKINNSFDIGITTNGVLLSDKMANELYKSGLDRITVSLDSLDNKKFQKLSNSKYRVSDVLEGIDNARKAGFKNIKVNMVVIKDFNDEDIVPILQYFYNKNIIVRFIEYMDVGNTNNWSMDDVITKENILKIIKKKFFINDLEKNYLSEVANRWGYDGGEFGIISSISSPFCQNCSRLRLTAEGMLYTCLFSNNGHDVKEVLRKYKNDAEVSKFIMKMWQKRNDQYSLDRLNNLDNIKILRKAEMSYIGG
tara:strand:- start:552 stop:1478 length:927 start_codon:yes stop_codon:yes gene_type:complete